MTDKGDTDQITKDKDLAGLLPRIDERTKQLVKSVDDINNKLENHYVSQEEFQPIKTIVYGFVGVILLAVVSSLVALVIHAAK